jgi:hypothetical protein
MSISVNFTALGSLFFASYDPQCYGRGIRTHFHTGNWWLNNDYNSEWKSELLYDGRYTANQFVLAPSPLTIMASDFFL